MSLINKMLRDLDARHAASGQTTMPGEVRPLPERVKRSRGSRTLLMLLALLALGAAAGWQTQAYWLPQVQALLAPPPPPPVVKQQAPPMIVLGLPSVSETLPPPEPPVTPAAPAEVQNLKLDSSLPQVPGEAPPAAAKKPKAEPAPAKVAARVVIDKQQRLVGPQERAEAEYRKGLAAFKLGHATEAVAQFKSVLLEDPRHMAARQTLLAMLAEQKRWDEAQAVLNEGLELMPTQVGWAMALARIEVERGNSIAAWETLQKYMAIGEKNADYLGFAGVLLQRMQKPREASLRYQAALALKPNEGRWWLGLGLALEADGRAAEARNVFRRARSADGLTPEMLAVIEREMR